MQVVIKIDEARFKDIQRIAEVQLNRRTDTVEQLIVKGIPIPDNATVCEIEQIRAEIDRQHKWLLQAGYTAYNVDIAFDTIKAVIAESEDK